MFSWLGRSTPAVIRTSLGQLLPGWHKRAVGGMWEEMGKLQFEYMVSQGLQPEHYLLDVGCGSLRGGIHFVRYLETGHYSGIDSNARLLKAGRRELKKQTLDDRKPVLVQTDTFDFQVLHRSFDCALAVSVFTHISLNSITLCLMNMENVLKPGGRFYATFFENPQGKRNLRPLAQLGSDRNRQTYFDRDPYHYDFATFEWICEGTTLTAQYIGDWNHPRSQKMMLFVKSS